MAWIVLVALAVAGGAPLHEMDGPGATAYLSGLAAEEPSYGARVARVVKQGLGTPYAGDPLGEGPEGTHDRDPMMDLSRADCVTFVEQVFALAAATSYDEAFATLQRIRYKQGIVGYGNRNHFFVADWIASNPWCRDVTTTLVKSPDRATRRISRREFFERVKAPAFGKDLPDETVSVAYVPAARVREAEPAMPSPCLVVFIGKIDWLFALHCGIYVREDDGTGRLYHASSKAKKVVAVPFAEYLGGSGRYLGFTAYAVGKPEWDEDAGEKVQK